MACQAIQSHCSAGAKVLGTEFPVEQKDRDIARKQCFFCLGRSGEVGGELEFPLEQEVGAV